MEFPTEVFVAGALLAILAILFLVLSDADATLLWYHLTSSPKDYDGQVVWITGASAGIGEYLAYGFAKRHAKLVLSGVNTQRLSAVRKHCIELAKCEEEDVLSLPFLIDDFAVHDECVKKVLDHFGHIDILVNNAGYSQRAEFKDVDIDVDIKLFNVNVFGAVNLTRKVLNHFLERNRGHFVVTSSMAGKLGAPFSRAYTGSKHALHGYFECLRTELIGKNIDVTIACPGPVFSLITDRCVTGKLGELFSHKPQPTDRKMKTERCSDLMLTAISHRLDEGWMVVQPLLIVMYLAQYMPTFFRTQIMRRIFSKRLSDRIREGR